MRDRIAIAATILLLIAFIDLLVVRGAPYFERPATIVDHINEDKHATRDALLLLPVIQPLLPRGATVACFHPKNGKWQWDVASFLTAAGLLPRQVVLPPYAASEDIAKNTLATYVVALGEPFNHPAYHLEATFANGRLYKVVR